jgi:CubicO group peptidase (beta-lactamase class C family)
MHQQVGTHLVAFALLTLSRTPGAQPPPDTASDASVFAEIDRYAEALLRADRVPGASIALVHRGRIVLDAPVRTYLPAFRIASPDSGATLTVRQRVLHTSGLPHGVVRGRRRTLGDHIDALRTVSPKRAPGTAHAYASPNYLVLGAIVEAVSGESFASYVDRHIFGARGMQHSYTDRVRAISQGLAGGHVKAFGFPVASSLAAEPDRLPTAGLMSSAGDLARFLSMFLQQGRANNRPFLSAESVRQMQTGGAPSDGFAYAFGWRDGRIGGVRAVHHGGIVPDVRGKMVMLPDSGWGVAVLTNVSSAIPWPLTPTSHRLADDIAARLAGQPWPRPASRHRVMCALIAAAMGVLLLAQLRTQVREVRAARRLASAAAAARRAWRSAVLDGALLVGIALLPRLIGLSWADLLAGAPDVAWWLITMGSLGAMIMVSRVLRVTTRTATA